MLMSKAWLLQIQLALPLDRSSCISLAGSPLNAKMGKLSLTLLYSTLSLSYDVWYLQLAWFFVWNKFCCNKPSGVMSRSVGGQRSDIWTPGSSQKKVGEQRPDCSSSRQREPPCGVNPYPKRHRGSTEEDLQWERKNAGWSGKGKQIPIPTLPGFDGWCQSTAKVRRPGWQNQNCSQLPRHDTIQAQCMPSSTSPRRQEVVMPVCNIKQ